MNDLNFNQVTKIKVIGVGGGGCNAVNRMVEESTVVGVDFYVANTDLQVLKTSKVEDENRILLGKNTTHGLGAGGNPKIGHQAAEENIDEIKELVKGTDMVFITAGLGGGTGTGAAPIFAKAAQDAGALTVAVVTKPFTFEGPRRMSQALEGLDELRQYTDSLIIIPNNRVKEILGNIPFKDSFKETDNILVQAVKTVTDLIGYQAMINIDFADIRSVMEDQGTALIGIGMADGENRAIEAAKKAIESPLLEASITGASNALINITGGNDITANDASAAVDYIRAAAGGNIDTIFGVAFNENLGSRIIVTVIATGFDSVADPAETAVRPVKPAETGFKEAPVDDYDTPDFFKKRS